MKPAVQWAEPAVQWVESAQSRQRPGQNLGFVHIPEEGWENIATFTGIGRD